VKIQSDRTDIHVVACSQTKSRKLQQLGVADLSGVPMLLSEDMHSGLLIEGLMIQNPFK
jgi:predicted nucleic acid-binding protein